MAIGASQVHGVSRSAFSSVFVQSLDHFHIPILGCTIHRFSRAPFKWVFVPLYHFKIARSSSLVYGHGYASIRSVVMKPLHHFHVVPSSGSIHSVVHAPFLLIFMELLHHFQVVSDRSIIRGVLSTFCASVFMQPSSHYQMITTR